ncbi:MAG: hypothetical protein AMJ65_05355 [Phycisphaerae bacterium SG8_4]|nr:MAG: hypothetical protein AMJ65_05355 [Phycisphaerae bacterium SG8_4]
MRPKYFALVHLVVGCALLWQSGCQQQSRIGTGPEALEEPGNVGTADAGGPQPKIAFEASGLDFGEVPPNQLNKGQIKFTNTGEGVLKISKVARCCSVVASLAGEKEEYAPGESGAVNVEWRSGSQPLDFARELVIHSNDKSNAAAKLKIQAKIVLRVTWEPKRLRLFLDEDNAGSQNLTISSLDDQAFSITSFKSTGECITADFDPSVKATQFVLEPKVDTEKLNDNLKGRITVGLTHPDGNAAVILFDVLAKYSISPPLLILFYAEPGEPMVRKISVLNNYKKDFDVDSLSSKSGMVGVKILDKRKITNGYQLEVELTPPPAEGKMRFVDEFYLTLEDGEKLPIKCNGYFRKTKPVSTTQ